MNAPTTLTLQEMEAAAQAALALDRARGAPIPQHEMVEEVYMVGFAAGADWVLNKLRGDL